MGFIKSFWVGLCGFVVTVGTLIGVSIVLSYTALWMGWVIIPILAVVSVWQVVGAWRFGERMLRDGALTRVYGVYAAAGVAVLSNILMGIGLLLPAPPVDLTVQGYAPKVVAKDGVARVTGDIDYQILTELKAVQNVRTVVLDSTGGQVQAGRAIGLFIAAQGWQTRVEDVCFSACTLAFLGGVSRAIGAEGQLGFHGYRFVDPLQVQTVDKADIEEKDRRFLAAQGVSADFIDRVFATPPEELWQPTQAELNAGGVLR